MKAKFHYLQYWAHRMVAAAIKHGDLVRPPICSKCGKTDEMTEAHHHDYSQPLDVTWLCRACHLDEHGRMLNPHQKVPNASKRVYAHLDDHPEDLNLSPRALALKLGVGKSTANNVQRMRRGQAGYTNGQGDVVQ